MVRPLQALRSELHARFLTLRNLDRFIHEEVFEKTLEAAARSFREAAKDGEARGQRPFA